MRQPLGALPGGSTALSAGTPSRTTVRSQEGFKVPMPLPSKVRDLASPWLLSATLIVCSLDPAHFLHLLHHQTSQSLGRRLLFAAAARVGSVNVPLGLFPLPPSPLCFLPRELLRSHSQLGLAQAQLPRLLLLAHSLQTCSAAMEAAVAHPLARPAQIRSRTHRSWLLALPAAGQLG